MEGVKGFKEGRMTVPSIQGPNIHQHGNRDSAYISAFVCTCRIRNAVLRLWISKLFEQRRRINGKEKGRGGRGKTSFPCPRGWMRGKASIFCAFFFVWSCLVDDGWCSLVAFWLGKGRERETTAQNLIAMKHWLSGNGN